MKKLTGKRFKVWVDGEVERTTNFNGMLRILHRFSDFFGYTLAEQRQTVKKWLSSRQIYVDANIILTF